MDTENVAQEICTLQEPPELNPAAKRLLLSAHLNLISKKLRRGVCAEAGEILALLAFTVPNSGRSDENTSAIDFSDKEWAERVAGVLP